MKKTYTIIEFESFVCGGDKKGYKGLPQKTFLELEDFILNNNSYNEDFLNIMSISYKKSVGKIITARNYVGIISMKDGTTIEILPKIFSNTEFGENQVKQLLIDMIKILTNVPFKSIQNTNVNVERMNIFEIFIRMFIEEVIRITKRGLKRNYENVSENEKFFKGKLKLSEHLKYNFIHKERCYVEFDNFSLNRVENKLIKTTLKYLYNRTISGKNKKDLNILLNIFDEIDISTNIDSDFRKCNIDRSTSDYTEILKWCNVFLKGRSFTAYNGSQVAISLLFPMEILFEKYVSFYIKKIFTKYNYSVKLQDNCLHLFEIPTGKFLLRPDIVLKHNSNDEILILDTKWKILSLDKSNYGISQSDMYQMYAYNKRYGAKSVSLIYPTVNIFDKEISFENINEKVLIKFVDLFNIEDSLKNILELI